MKNCKKDNLLIAEIGTHFSTCGHLVSYERITRGHINDTFKIITDKGAYLMQRISPIAFKDPLKVMHNIAGVTKFLRQRIIEEGGNPDTECLNLVDSDEHTPYWLDQKSGDVWRVYLYIDGVSYDMPESTEAFEKAAIAFGRFQYLLADYPAADLYEVIPHFHDTPKRFLDLDESVKKDALGRKKNCEELIAKAYARKDTLSKIVDGLANGSIPLRTTHNDTKLNNIMFDATGTTPLCILDLDTIMPGSALYDFGDSIRFGANTAAEDEKDVSKIHFNIEMFKAYARGFLKGSSNSLSKNEILLFPYSAMLLTYECGIRFLKDYLDGDVYFHVAYDDHNLVRAIDQFTLLEDMEKQEEEMDAFVKSLL